MQEKTLNSHTKQQQYVLTMHRQKSNVNTAFCFYKMYSQYISQRIHIIKRTHGLHSERHSFYDPDIKKKFQNHKLFWHLPLVYCTGKTYIKQAHKINSQKYVLAPKKKKNNDCEMNKKENILTKRRQVTEFIKNNNLFFPVTKIF